MNFPTVNMYTVLSDTLSVAWDGIQDDRAAKEEYSRPAADDNIYAEPRYEENTVDIYA